METKLRKSCLTEYNLLLAQDLWQARYQVLLKDLNVTLTERIHRIKCKYKHNDKKMWNLWNYIQAFLTSLLNTENLKLFNRIQMFMLQKELSKKASWIVTGTIFQYIQIL